MIHSAPPFAPALSGVPVAPPPQPIASSAVAAPQSNAPPWSRREVSFERLFKVSSLVAGSDRQAGSGSQNPVPQAPTVPAQLKNHDAVVSRVSKLKLTVAQRSHARPRAIRRSA